MDEPHSILTSLNLEIPAISMLRAKKIQDPWTSYTYYKIDTSDIDNIRSIRRSIELIQMCTEKIYEYNMYIYMVMLNNWKIENPEVTVSQILSTWPCQNPNASVFSHEPQHVMISR